MDPGGGGLGVTTPPPPQRDSECPKNCFRSLNVIVSIYGDAKLGKHIILIARDINYLDDNGLPIILLKGHRQGCECDPG